MLKSLNQFIKFLFILILVARISVSQPKESKDATKCATKCINDMEKLAQLKQACETMTMSKCSSHFDARTERTPKSSRKCFRVNTRRSATKNAECVQLLQNTTSQIKSCYTFVYFCIHPDSAKFLEQEIRNAGAHSVQKRDITMKQDSSVKLRKTPDFIKTMTRLIRSAPITSNSTSSSMAPIRLNPTSSSMATTQPTTGQNISNTSNTTSTSTPSNMPSSTPSNMSTSSPSLSSMSTHTLSNMKYISNPSVIPTFFDDWAHTLLVVLLLLIAIGSIFTVVLFKYCKRKISGNIQNYTVELRPVSPTSTLCQNERQNSPVYCEADIVQFSSREPRSETPTDVESNSEDEYCYPENIEDNYETVNPVNPPQASGEYAYAYDHVNINAGYMNTFSYKRPTNGVEDDYEYPQNNSSSSDNEYRYAYDWRDPGFREATLSSSEPVLAYTPLDTDKVDDNFDENYQTLSRSSLEKENGTVPLEYVTVQ